MSNLTSVAGVERNDLASGRIARAFSGAYNIMQEGPNIPTADSRRPCRAIVATGAVTYTGIDGVNVTLPATGGTFWWDIQATAIVSGTGVVVW